jgi:hypothetical protein
VGCFGYCRSRGNGRLLNVVAKVVALLQCFGSLMLAVVGKAMTTMKLCWRSKQSALEIPGAEARS